MVGDRAAIDAGIGMGREFESKRPKYSAQRPKNLRAE